jgi:hypothetical protein
MQYLLHVSGLEDMCAAGRVCYEAAVGTASVAVARVSNSITVLFDSFVCPVTTRQAPATKPCMPQEDTEARSGYYSSRHGLVQSTPLNDISGCGCPCPPPPPPPIPPPPAPKPFPPCLHQQDSAHVLTDDAPAGMTALQGGNEQSTVIVIQDSQPESTASDVCMIDSLSSGSDLPLVSKPGCNQSLPTPPPMVWNEARRCSHAQVLGAAHTARQQAAAAAARVPPSTLMTALEAVSARQTGTVPTSRNALFQGVADILLAAVTATVALVDGKPADSNLIASEALKRLACETIVRGLPQEAGSIGDVDPTSDSDSDIDDHDDDAPAGGGPCSTSTAFEQLPNAIPVASVEQAVQMVTANVRVQQQVDETMQREAEACIASAPAMPGLSSAEDLLLSRGFGVTDEDRQLLAHQGGWSHDAAAGTVQSKVITATQLSASDIKQWWDIIDRGPRRAAVAEQAHQAGPISMLGRAQLVGNINSVDVPRMLTAAKELELQMRIGKHGLQLALWTNR